MAHITPPSPASMQVRHTHLVPTHAHTPDVLLTIAGIPVSIRQFLLLVVGSTLGYRCWLLLAVLAAVPSGPVFRVLAALLVFAMSLGLAFLRLAGRGMEGWLAVVTRYLLRPRVCLWRSIRLIEPDLDRVFFDHDEDQKEDPT